jgi:ABC-type multidrug transport system ATPase subunit
MERGDQVQCKRYRPSFNHVTFSVQRSEILGLLGPNGAGTLATTQAIIFLELRGNCLPVQTW